MNTRNKVLIWLPAALLPLANLVSAAVSRTAPSPALQVLLFAVIEELLYRWLLLGKVLLRQKLFKPKASIVIVALIFAAMHLWNLRTGAAVSAVLLQVYFAFCFSIWAGAAVWKMRIAPPLIAHMLLNLTAVDGGVVIPLITGAIVLIDGMSLMKEKPESPARRNGENALAGPPPR